MAEGNEVTKKDLVVPIATHVDLSKEDPKILNQLYINKGWRAEKNDDGTFDVVEEVVGATKQK